MGESRNTKFFAPTVYRVLAFSNLHYCQRWCLVGSLCSQSFQEPPHVRNHWHAANTPILGARSRIATHGDFTFFKIAVGPGNLRCFALSEAAERKEANQLSTVTAVSSVDSL